MTVRLDAYALEALRLEIRRLAARSGIALRHVETGTRTRRP
jgi:hypothetical protein